MVPAAPLLAAKPAIAPVDEDDGEIFELCAVAPKLSLRVCCCCPRGEPDPRSCLILGFLRRVPPAPAGTCLP